MEHKDEQVNVSEILLQNAKICNKDDSIQVYKRRWLVLTIFLLYTIINQAQWIEYVIITNIVMKYYNVSALAIDWTSIIYMVLYLPLIIPFAYIIDVSGLRVAALIGGLGTALGSVIKLFSASPELFWVTFLGQVILSIAEVPILCLPTRIAAVWFAPNEVSTACSIGVIGMQLGVALGFVMPSIFVKNHDKMEEVGSELYVMYWFYAGIMIPISLLLIIFFQAQPKLPPSELQLQERNTQKKPGLNFFLALNGLIQNKNYLLHTVAYGINVGTYCAMGTMLNLYILTYFPNSEEDAGRMGLVMVIIGIFGSITFGVVLDKTRKFKEICCSIYIMTCLSTIIFLYVLEIESKVAVYIAISFVGFCTNTYIAVGFELAVELTYPTNESTTSGILFGVSQLFGVGFTLLSEKIVASWGTYWALWTQTGFLILGTLITFLIPNKMLRQAALKSESKDKPNELLLRQLPII